jgi:hypothetical protein
MATLTTLVPYAYSAAAEVKLMITDREAFSVRRLGVDVTVAGLAFAYTLWTIAGSGYQVVFRGFLLMLAGIPVYLFMLWRNAGTAEEAGTADDAEPGTAREADDADDDRPAPPLGLTA